MQLNADKTKVVIFGPDIITLVPYLHLYLHNLGVTFDKSMTFDTYIRILSLSSKKHIHIQHQVCTAVILFLPAWINLLYIAYKLSKILPLHF